MGVRRHGDREDYVVVVGAPGSVTRKAAQGLSGNSSNLLSSQALNRGMSFNHSSAAGGSGVNGGAVPMGYTNYGAPPAR